MDAHGLAGVSRDPISLAKDRWRIAAETEVGTTDEPTLAVQDYRLDDGCDQTRVGESEAAQGFQRGLRAESDVRKLRLCSAYAMPTTDLDRDVDQVLRSNTTLVDCGFDGNHSEVPWGREEQIDKGSENVGHVDLADLDYLAWVQVMAMQAYFLPPLDRGQARNRQVDEVVLRSPEPRQSTSAGQSV